MNKKAKVFVGVSGGVDSSVSLMLLRDAGYDVTGVFIKTWQPDFIECTMVEERRDAIRVCAHAGVPFLELDAEEEYKKHVADYLVKGYEEGRIPNGDILCNREIKFGVFSEFAKAHGADYIATGHYAKVMEHESCNMEHENKMLHATCYMLHFAEDTAKDQTYFLWKLTQDDLAHILFPLGDLTKPEVRKLAQIYNLPTATKKDSQGVCMLGDLDMKDFLGHYIKEEEGNVVLQNGTKIGTHKGVRFYTVGERHGFTLTENSPEQKPYYIIARDIKKNELVVTNSPEEIFGKPLEVTFSEANAIRTPFSVGQKFDVRFRHRGTLYPGVVKKVDGESIVVAFNGLDKGIDVGQSGVFYENEECLGGGVIEHVAHIM